MKTILSVDCGTQSLRVILFDINGKPLAIYKKVYSPAYSSPKPGWAEQDVETYWQAMCEGIAVVKKKHPQGFAALKGIGVTSQRDTLVLVDKDQKVLYPAILWLDTRAASGPHKPSLLLRSLYKLFGVYDKIMKVQAYGRTNWIKENHPAIWQKTDKALLLSTYFHLRLCGKAVDSAASMVGHIPFKNRRRNWGSDFSIESLLLPLEKSKRCEIVESGKVIGSITAKAAQETSLPQGLPLVACGSDKACETIGMGVIDSSLASFSFGTTATVEVCSKKYFEPIFAMPAYCSVLADSWLAEIEIFRGYWMIRWFSSELARAIKEEAQKKGLEPEVLFERMLEETPAGGHGLLLLPYWGASLKDVFAKGAVIGFGDIHGQAYLYRAIVEGLAYALREGLEIMEKKGDFHCRAIAVSGGASQSDKICQITSDILNRPLLRGSTHETSALGAAIVTAAGVGVYGSIEEAAKSMVNYEKTFSPNAENRKIYAGLFNVYKKMYPALQKLYKEIQEISGYPETEKIKPSIQQKLKI